MPQAEGAELCQTGAMLLDVLRMGGVSSEVMYESIARVFLVKLLQRYGGERHEPIEFARGFTAQHYKSRE